MIKHFTFFIFACTSLLFSKAFCQQTLHLPGMNQPKFGYAWFFHGILFEPINGQSNADLHCSNTQEEFIINGFKLSSSQLASLNLKDRELSNHEHSLFRRSTSIVGHGYYEYKLPPTDTCSEKITGRLAVDLPIFVDGVRIADSVDINDGSRDNLVIKSIKREKVFLGVDKILIELERQK